LFFIVLKQRGYFAAFDVFPLTSTSEGKLADDERDVRKIGSKSHSPRGIRIQEETFDETLLLGHPSLVSYKKQFHWHGHLINISSVVTSGRVIRYSRGCLLIGSRLFKYSHRAYQ